jgi:hypothetical protein
MAQRPPRKQQYVPPLVRVQGSIEHLTQALGVAGADALGGSTLG